MHCYSTYCFSCKILVSQALGSELVKISISFVIIYANWILLLLNIGYVSNETNTDVHIYTLKNLF